MINSKTQKIGSYLFYLLIFLVPWPVRWIYQQAWLNEQKWEYGTLSLYGGEVVFGLLVLFLIGVFIQHVVITKRPSFTMPTNKSYKIIIFLIVYLFINLWLSIDQTISWQYLSWFWQGLAIMFFWQLFVNSWQKANYLLLTAGLLQSCLAIFQFLTQKVIGNSWLGMAQQSVSVLGASVVEGTGRFLRAYGSFSHPNILGGFLVIIIIINIYWLWRFYQQQGSINRHSNYQQVLHYLFLVIGLMVNSYALCVSFSRSAWLGLVVGLSLLAITIFRKAGRLERIRGLQIIAPLLLVVIFFISTNYQLFLNRVDGQSRLEIMSNQQRTTSLIEAKSIISNNLLIGVGIGNYTTYSYWLNHFHPAWEYQPVHNLYLLIWSEIGLCGLLLIIALLFITIKNLWPLNTVEQKIKFSLAMALLTIGLFDHYWWSLYSGMMLWWLAWGWVAKKV